MANKWVIFSDGGTFNNGYKKPDLPQFATSGIVVTLNDEVIYEGSKTYEGDHATISYAELNGVLLALKVLRKIVKDHDLQGPHTVEVWSDSAYVINSASGYIHKWRKNNWMNSTGNEVAQKDLWVELDREFISNRLWNVTFNHIKGHTNKQDFFSLMNQKCDDLCTANLKKFKSERGYR